MSEAQKGVIAAGHPLTAQAGARVLREGGNAVDAAVAAMLASFANEPLLTGLGVVSAPTYARSVASMPAERPASVRANLHSSRQTPAGCDRALPPGRPRGLIRMRRPTAVL